MDPDRWTVCTHPVYPREWSLRRNVRHGYVHALSEHTNNPIRFVSVLDAQKRADAMNATQTEPQQ